MRVPSGIFRVLIRRLRPLYGPRRLPLAITSQVKAGEKRPRANQYWRDEPQRERECAVVANEREPRRGQGRPPSCDSISMWEACDCGRLSGPTRRRQILLGKQRLRLAKPASVDLGRTRGLFRE